MNTLALLVLIAFALVSLTSYALAVGYGLGGGLATTWRYDNGLTPKWGHGGPGFGYGGYGPGYGGYGYGGYGGPGYGGPGYGGFGYGR